MMSYSKKVQELKEKGVLPPKIAQLLSVFYQDYLKSVLNNGVSTERAEQLLATFLDKVVKQIQYPIAFQPFHAAVRTPFDYYRFGLEFIGALIQIERSALIGSEYLREIDAALACGENAILLGNHQTEPDPQAISLLLSRDFNHLAKEMIMVAGHRVISDPMAAPFSLGCNLLCIYSKKHIDHPPEERFEKLQHNRRTMKQMAALLEEGGKCIYMAPSGGRDRPNSLGKVVVTPFDPQSIEMFYLMAQHAKQPTRFYPLALATYPLFPPPQEVGRELGELRRTSSTPIFISVGPKIDMDHFSGSCPDHKKQHRHARAEHIWSLVNALYSDIEGRL